MIECSEEYKAAIVADARRMYISALIDITDPDIIYGVVNSSGEDVRLSRSEQVYDRKIDATPYGTCEHNRWPLDGTVIPPPEDPADMTGEAGFVGSVFCDGEGMFQTPQFVELQFSNVSILQACSVYFSDYPPDGYAVDFTVEVKQGGTAYFTQTFQDNRERAVFMTDFTVYDPDCIRVTVTKWSLPRRRLRALELVPGLLERWDGDMITSFSTKQQGDVSCIALPYGTAEIVVDNQNRRFEPRNKSGVFSSIEERQAIQVLLGVRLSDGSVEYKQVGVFYQYAGGWKTSGNGITIRWSLVDIVGLISAREFIPPSSLPTTLAGWVSSIVAQLGVNFANRWHVDPDYSDFPLTVNSLEDISGMTCGELLRCACMASGTWPRADAETGYLTAEPLWSQGNKLTLENLNSYPVMKSNPDIAAVIFTLADGDGTKITVSGTSTSSNETLSVQNPFLHTKAQALVAARSILTSYGGIRLETSGRGDPAGEIGDVDVIWLDEKSAATARRIRQDLSMTDGVLKNCASELLQADGSFLYQKRVVLTQSGTWTAPPGVHQLRVILVGKGGDGGPGTDGTFERPGQKGTDGLGAKVWAGTIPINEQQVFELSVGADTVLGNYTSAAGKRYEYGYTDVASGDVFGRTGVAAPAVGSGDGGAGGAGGRQGYRVHIIEWIYQIYWYPGPGEQGAPGATGCAVIYWEADNGQTV